MTYEGRQPRASSRVLTTLVVVTIIVVAIWAIRGGLDSIPVTEAESVVVTD